MTTTLGTPTQSVKHRAVPVPAAQPAPRQQLSGSAAAQLSCAVRQSIQHPSSNTQQILQNTGVGKGQTK